MMYTGARSGRRHRGNVSLPNNCLAPLTFSFFLLNLRLILSCLEFEFLLNFGG